MSTNPITILFLKLLSLSSISAKSCLLAYVQHIANVFEILQADVKICSVNIPPDMTDGQRMLATYPLSAVPKNCMYVLRSLQSENDSTVSGLPINFFSSA